MEILDHERRNALRLNIWRTISSMLLCFMFVAIGISPSVATGDEATSTTHAGAQNAYDKEVQLQKQLDDINLEIKGLGNTVTGLQGEGQSIDRDIKLLNANIERANLNIKARNLTIGQLSQGITEKTRTIQSLSKKLDNERQSLFQLIRKTNELDQASLAEVVLGNTSLSDFFLDLDSFDAIRAGLKNSSDSLKSAKIQTLAAQEALETKQKKERDAEAELERNKKIVQSNQVQKKQLLSITKNKESQYRQVLVDRKKQAAQIRAALFALRDSGEINFGKALDYANVVSAKTGIRPAYLLAIFQQESSFGKNQGSCILKDKNTGAGVGIRSGSVIQKVMNPTRDVPPFLTLTAKLGVDPYNTRVSCPQEVGWGGAMGAAQFIPSTWVMFANRITNALGTDVADPWSARDAFMAAGLYLKDLGADPSSYSGERDAACKYFSGSKCSRSSWAATYGSQVMTKAESIQTSMIDALQNT